MNRHDLDSLTSGSGFLDSLGNFQSISKFKTSWSELIKREGQKRLSFFFVHVGNS